MLDRSAARSARRRPAAPVEGGGRTPRRRALLACASLALALHAGFIDGLGRFASGTEAVAIVAPMSVRTLSSALALAPGAEVKVATSPVIVPVPSAQAPRRVGEPATPEPIYASEGRNSDDASANLPKSLEYAESTGVVRSDSAPVAMPVAVESIGPSTIVAAGVGEAPSATVAVAGPETPPTLLGAGEPPPPLYRTQLPPSVTLHYQVRRGFLSGTGEIRWHAAGDSYSLVLEARIAGLTLLRQSSEGGIGAHGLAPVRFLDQRARRVPQAANFRHADGRITFSGTGVEWPLLGGSQDRLSWMIQLAGIAAADPQLLVNGGRITMVVVGARGDAGVWTLRYAGRETIETASGPVHAAKLVREARSAHDTGAEIWLDPERSYLPARATLLNSAGASEYDLLLERVDPG